MKQFKKLAACLLATVMALAMLTACGGSEETLVCDSELETNVIGWIEQYMQENGYEVTADEKLDTVVEAALPSAVAYRSAQINKESESVVNAQYKKLCGVIQTKFDSTGKTGYVFSTQYGRTAIDKGVIDNIMKGSLNAIVSGLQEHNVEEPKTVAVGITKKGEYNYIMFIFSD